MPIKLKPLQDSLGSKILSTALTLCAIEVGVFLAAIPLSFFLGRFDFLAVRVNAISWLVCGVASIILSIAGLVKGPKRAAACWVLLFCSAMFILCGFRFS